MNEPCLSASLQAISVSAKQDFTHILDPDEILPCPSQMRSPSKCHGSLLQAKCPNRMTIASHDPVGSLASDESPGHTLDIAEWQKRVREFGVTRGRQVLCVDFTEADGEGSAGLCTCVERVSGEGFVHVQATGLM